MDSAADTQEIDAIAPSFDVEAVAKKIAADAQPKGNFGLIDTLWQKAFDDNIYTRISKTVPEEHKSAVIAALIGSGSLTDPDCELFDEPGSCSHFATDTICPNCDPENYWAGAVDASAAADDADMVTDPFTAEENARWQEEADYHADRMLEDAQAQSADEENPKLEDDDDNIDFSGLAAQLVENAFSKLGNGLIDKMVAPEHKAIVDGQIRAAIFDDSPIAPKKERKLAGLMQGIKRVLRLG